VSPEFVEGLKITEWCEKRFGLGRAPQGKGGSMTEEQKKLNAMTPEKRRKAVQAWGDDRHPTTGHYYADEFLAALKAADEAAGEERGRIAELRNMIHMFEKEIRPDEDDSLLDEAYDSGIGECIQRVRFRLAELKEDTP
jgi:hypothetical protein